MRWQSGLVSLVTFLSGPLALSVRADVQSGNYHLVVTNAQGAAGQTTRSPGPLGGLLPQTSELQQWCLLAIGLIGLILLTVLTIIWWRNRQLIKEQP
ncbi:cell surface protein [Lactiplantibacillus carotarum]|uniref:cell surface protein n=1 Tax=Lactiplantibacillus carotarum TaxID=2993456 RepID=UPI00298F1C8E|nr:cell surface protein [Lactiplantibacillus carotarum]